MTSYVRYAFLAIRLLCITSYVYYAFLKLGYAHETKVEWEESLYLDIKWPFDRVADIEYAGEIALSVRCAAEGFNIVFPESVFTFLITDVRDDDDIPSRINYHERPPYYTKSDPFVDGSLISKHGMLGKVQGS